MAALIPLSTTIHRLNQGGHLQVHEVNYLAASDTVAVDKQVTAASVIHLDGGTAPDVAVAAPSGETVVLTLGGSTAGTAGRILVLCKTSGNTSL